MRAIRSQCDFGRLPHAGSRAGGSMNPVDWGVGVLVEGCVSRTGTGAWRIPLAGYHSRSPQTSLRKRS